MKKRLKKTAPFLAFFLLVFAFHLLFVRLLPKTDDGNFLGIVSDPAFTYAGWLRERYLTVSGRTVGEFLLSFFLKKPLVFWKFFNALAITYISWFWVCLSSFFSEKNETDSTKLFCFCGLFTMVASCLNPGAFWFSGSFSYLWPFAGLLAAIEPLAEYYFTGRFCALRALISLPCVLLATMQEQSALCCAALYLLLIASIAVKQKRMNALVLLPLALIGVCCFHLFSSPGIRGRIAMETAGRFAAYGSFSAAKKLLCGAANFFANAYFFGLFLPLLFTALLIVKINRSALKNSVKKACRFCGALEGLGVLFVLVGAAFAKTLPHILVRTAFQSGNFSAAFRLLFAGGFLITAAIVSLIVLLMIYEKTVGIPVGVCAAAAFCSALVMGFSPTVFASGQRVFFFTNTFLFTACATLFSSIDESKAKSAALKVTVFYACATFCLNCVAFQLFEHPLMG